MEKSLKILGIVVTVLIGIAAVQSIYLNRKQIQQMKAGCGCED